jgi:hypothetical protein
LEFVGFLANFVPDIIPMAKANAGDAKANPEWLLVVL